MSFWSQSRKPKYESSPRLFFFSPSAQIQPGHTKITRARRRFTDLLKKNYKSKKGSEYLKVITTYGRLLKKISALSEFALNEDHM